MVRAKYSKRSAVLIAIIVLKYLKGLLFIATGAALFFFQKDPSSRWLLHLAEKADGDPRLRLTAHVFRDLSHSFELHFSAIVASCLIAGLALAGEGTFLLRGYVWAPWVTIVLTGIWVPVELWDVIQSFSIRTLVLMAVNIAIVVYLFVHRKDFHRHIALE